jgi:hypothetical protein
MADLIATVTSSLTQDLFGSLDYPYRMRIDDKMAVDASPDAGEVTIDWLPNGSTEENHGFEADFEPLLDALIVSVLDQRPNKLLASDEEDAEAAALVEPYIGDDASSRSAQVVMIKERMEQDAAFATKFQGFLQSRLSTGIDWVEAELSQMPNSAMGNPLSLSNLRMAVRAKAKACIRVFGREYCISATSPWIRFEGRRAALFLDVVGLRIYGRARVTDLDFVMTIRILGREIRIRIGVTGLVNRQLERQRPLLADFATVAITVPGVSRVYRPTALAIPTSTTETRIEVDGSFARS